MSKSRDFISTDWGKWSIATMIAAMTMTATGVSAAYSIFRTKSEAQEAFTILEKRLDRIEDKVDDTLSWLKKRHAEK